MRYVYFDESRFGVPRQCIGYGALVTDGEVDPALIKRALGALSADEDRHLPASKNYDDKTLSREYFHASFDSKNAHSHFCAAINAHLVGEFVCDFVDPSKIVGGRKEESFLFDHVQSLVSLSALNCRDRVQILVEQREGLTASSLERKFLEWEGIRLLTAYEQPFIPNYFPRIEIAVSNKKNAGIQCADFLLWTVNRHINCDSVWLDRVKTSRRAEFKSQPESWGGIDFALKNGLSEAEENYQITDMPLGSSEIESRSRLLDYMASAERRMGFILANRLPTHAEHHLPLLQKVVSTALDADNSEHLEDLCRIFLKLFDSLPLISATMSREEKGELLLARKYLGLVLRSDLPHGTSTSGFLQRARREKLGRPGH